MRYRKKHKCVEIRLLVLDFEAVIMLKAVKAYGANAKTKKTKFICDNIADLIENHIRRATDDN